MFLPRTMLQFNMSDLPVVPTDTAPTKLISTNYRIENAGCDVSLGIADAMLK